MNTNIEGNHNTPDGQGQSKLNEVFVIEAGSTMYWNKFTSIENIFGIDDFGASAPAKDVYNKFGLTPQKISSTIRKRIK